MTEKKNKEENFISDENARKFSEFMDKELNVPVWAMLLIIMGTTFIGMYWFAPPPVYNTEYVYFCEDEVVDAPDTQSNVTLEGLVGWIQELEMHPVLWVIVLLFLILVIK